MTLRSSQAQRVAMRAYLLARDGRGCGRCGDPIDARETPSLGHIVALARGGSDAPGNLRLEHLECNIAAGADDDRARIVNASMVQSGGRFLPPGSSRDRPLRCVKRCPNRTTKRTTVRFGTIAPRGARTAGDGS